MIFCEKCIHQKGCGNFHDKCELFAQWKKERDELAERQRQFVENSNRLISNSEICSRHGTKYDCKEYTERRDKIER